MANDIADRIRVRIDSFLSDLSGLVKRSAMEAVRETLGEGAAPKRGGPLSGSARCGPGGLPKAIPCARRAATRTGKSIRRSAKDLEAGAARVLAHVKSKRRQRLEQIGKALKTNTMNLKRPIANLLATMSVRHNTHAGTSASPHGQEREVLKPIRTAQPDRCNVVEQYL